MKNYSNSISNKKLDINLYYKFSKTIPKNFEWHSIGSNKEVIPSFTKNNKSYRGIILMKKKIAIIGSGIAGLALGNLLKKVKVVIL